jgi:hypothetical protein
LTLDQRLFGLRGVTSKRERSPSTVLRTLSIHPKHSASSTIASYATDGPAASFLYVTAQTPGEEAWCFASQRRHCVRERISSCS